MKQIFKTFSVSFTRDERKRISVKCVLNNFTNDTVIEFWAPNPPDYNASFSGSALPFSDSVIAYENTPNSGSFKPSTSEFTIDLLFPNSYYSNLGTKLIEPHVNVKIIQQNSEVVETIFLGEIAPFRTLTYPGNPRGRSGPEFYDRSSLTVPRSQEKILRSGGYPGMNVNTPKNFWGKFVPQP